MFFIKFLFQCVKHRSHTISSMLTQLKFILKHLGILSFQPTEHRWPSQWKFTANIIITSSLGFFSISSIIYSAKYLNMINIAKTAGFTYNNTIICLFIYLYFLVNHNGFHRLISHLEELINQSIISIISNLIIFYF